jgi:hypothetical protein
MPLSNKDLEGFLWNNPAECERRGLLTSHEFYQHGRRYRNLSLGLIGTAQLVKAQYWAPDSTYYLQVFLITTGQLNTGSYEHAQQLRTAVHDSLERAINRAGITARIVATIVLIEHEVNTCGDFISTLKIDTTCRAYTYAYGVTGLVFENVCKRWHITGLEHLPALATIAADLLVLREEEIGHDQARQQARLALGGPALTKRIRECAYRHTGGHSGKLGPVARLRRGRRGG